MHLSDEELTWVKLGVSQPLLVRGKNVEKLNKELETSLINAWDLKDRVNSSTATHHICCRDYLLLVIFIYLAENTLRISENLQLLDFVLLFDEHSRSAFVYLSHHNDNWDLEMFGYVELVYCWLRNFCLWGINYHHYIVRAVAAYSSDHRLRILLIAWYVYEC